MIYNNKIDSVLRTSLTKYSYYNGTFPVPDITPIKTRFESSRVGWCARAIDLRTNKTNFDKFENDELGFNGLFNKYKVREALDKIQSDVLIAGCAFLAVSGDRVMPFTATEATGTYDWNNQNLSDGIAVYKSRTKKSLVDSVIRPDTYIEYLPNQTILHQTAKDGSDITTVSNNPTGRPLIAVLTHRSSANQPFGRSVLRRAARLAALNASRTYKEMTIAGHFYNRKVNVILGADSESAPQTVERKDGDVLIVGPNENGQIPQIAEFAQHALAPFRDSIAQFREDFCSSTMLTAANLGKEGDAPQSPDQQRILSDDLIDDMQRWHREIGGQLKHFMTTLFMLENNLTAINEDLQAKIDAITPTWMPMLVTDLSKGGDAIIKLSTVAPAALKSRSIWRQLGLTSDEIDTIVKQLDNNKPLLY